MSGPGDHFIKALRRKSSMGTDKLRWAHPNGRSDDQDDKAGGKRCAEPSSTRTTRGIRGSDLSYSSSERYTESNQDSELGERGARVDVRRRRHVSRGLTRTVEEERVMRRIREGGRARELEPEGDAGGGGGADGAVASSAATAIRAETTAEREEDDERRRRSDRRRRRHHHEHERGNRRSEDVEEGAGPSTAQRGSRRAGGRAGGPDDGTTLVQAEQESDIPTEFTMNSRRNSRR